MYMNDIPIISPELFYVQMQLTPVYLPFHLEYLLVLQRWLTGWTA